MIDSATSKAAQQAGHHGNAQSESNRYRVQVDLVEARQVRRPVFAQQRDRGQG
jgi:hypothetical protein